MSILSFLTEDEQKEFDYPPLLSAETRALSFSITEKLDTKIKQLKTTTNKVGFFLQYGYFKACKRFFVTNRFRQEDIAYAAKILGIPLNQINFASYTMKIPHDHQIAILELLDYRPFDEGMSSWLQNEIKKHVERVSEPRELFFNVLQLLHGQHIEIPSYYKLSELITRHYLNYENTLIATIDRHLETMDRQALDALLEAKNERNKGVLSQFRIINQSTKW